MPFMHNRGAVARTLEYLKKGDIYLEKNVRILMFAFNYDKVAQAPHPRHAGLYNFVFWHLPQLQYKNPEVQMITFNKISPLPWIKAYYENDSSINIDCDGRTREEILDHVKLVFGTQKRDESSVIAMKKLEENRYLSNFGEKCLRHCMCELPGQVPCPAWSPLPREMTGKYRRECWINRN